MKRSEAVKFILKEFPTWNDSIQLDEYDVIGLLKIVEDMGMLPPKITVPSKMPGITDFTVNAWEPEDET